jgi:hypothetical protein
VLETVGDVTALVFGLPFASYTGVLIGATVIPVWNCNAALLPTHFLVSGLGASVGTLELAGNDAPALQWLGLGAAAVETAVGVAIEQETNPAEAPLKRGSSGWLIRLCRSIVGGGFGHHARGMDSCRACVGSRESAIGTCNNLPVVQDFTTRGTSSFASWAFVSGYGIISDRFIDVTNTGTTAE